MCCAWFRAAPTAALALCCAWIATLDNANAEVKIPGSLVVVQGLKPKGLRISVPDISGIDVVVINANINIPILHKETGQVSGRVSEAQGGYWSLEANDVALKPGDWVYFWVYTAAKDRDDKSDRTGGFRLVEELVDSNCRPTPTTVNGRPACAGELILEENFNTFNTSLWKHVVQFSDEHHLDFTTYTKDPENSFVKDGLLHLKATVLSEDNLVKATKLDGCTRTGTDPRFCERKPIGWDVLPPTKSARLTTNGTFSFRFGRIDIRAKAAAGDWLGSRLALEPKSGVYGRNIYESGYIEIAVIRGNADLVETSGRQAGAGLNIPSAGISTCGRTLFIINLCDLKPGKIFPDEMHLFSITWTPEILKIRIDNDCGVDINPPEGGFLNHGYFKGSCDSSWKHGTRMAPLDREFFLHLNLRPGGRGTFQPGSNSGGNLIPWSDDDPRAPLNFWRARDKWLPTWKSDMEIDYIKVWAL